jgi:hypothetical protein
MVHLLADGVDGWLPATCCMDMDDLASHADGGIETDNRYAAVVVCIIPCDLLMQNQIASYNVIHLGNGSMRSEVI